MKNLYINSFISKIGEIKTAATDKGVVLIALPNESKKNFEKKINKEFFTYKIKNGGVHNRRVEKEIIQYLDGKRNKFTVKIVLTGTDFQKAVLNKVAKIKYGETKTYGEIAILVNNAGASRAVGSANAKNKLPIIIPCHRVVESDGLGGYGGGINLKKKLLQLEKAISDNRFL
jgi:methylated-DNA-[protein]-cysteine S-methyltransferase